MVRKLGQGQGDRLPLALCGSRGAFDIHHALKVVVVVVVVDLLSERLTLANLFFVDFRL